MHPECMTKKESVTNMFINVSQSKIFLLENQTCNLNKSLKSISQFYMRLSKTQKILLTKNPCMKLTISSLKDRRSCLDFIIKEVIFMMDLRILLINKSSKKFERHQQNLKGQLSRFCINCKNLALHLIIMVIWMFHLFKIKMKSNGFRITHHWSN